MTPSDSARSTLSASESSESTSQMSLFGTMCERLRRRDCDPLLPTPNASPTAGSGADPLKRGRKLHRVALSWTPTTAGNYAAPSMADRDPGSWFHSSPQAIPASHSHSPGSDWARKMTATYGQRLGDYWLSSDPPDSWVRTLLGTSVWASMTCYLTWKKSVTPRGRLLFRLVPLMPRTAGIGSGLWDTPAAMEGRTLDRDQLIGRRERAKKNAKNGNGFGLTLGNAITMDGAPPDMKLNSAWVSRMMGYPDSWLDLTLDGEAIP